MAEQKNADLVIEGFEITLDCPEEEKESLEKKLNLISIGNGKDLCIMKCSGGSCTPAKLVVRDYGNIRKDKFEHGGIEIEVSEQYMSVMAQNQQVAYFVPENKSLGLGYGEQGLWVQITYKKYSEEE